MGSQRVGHDWVTEHMLSYILGIFCCINVLLFKTPFLMTVCWKWKWSYSVMSSSLQPHRLWHIWPLYPWNSLGKNTRLGCHFLLQGLFLTQVLNPGLPHCGQVLYCLSHQGSFPLSRGIFQTQGSNPGLPHCRRIPYQLSHKGSPTILEWVPIPSPAVLPDPEI